MEEEISLVRYAPGDNVTIINGRLEKTSSERTAKKKQNKKREISTAFKLFITAWAFLENGLFSGLRAGWSAMVYVLKQEHVYGYLCKTEDAGNFTLSSVTVNFSTSTENNSSISSNISWNSNNTIETISCNEQDAVFNQCFTIATATMALSALLYGQLNYKFGIRAPRVLSVVLFVGGACCFAFTDKDLPWLVFPGLLLISSGGMALYITNNQISYMYSTGSAAVVGLLCGALEASAIVQTIIKILYEHGISTFISYLTLAGLYTLTLISTIFFMPKDFISNEKVAEIVEVTVEDSDCDRDNQTSPITGSSETVYESKLGVTHGSFKIKRNDTFKDNKNASNLVNNSKITEKEISVSIDEPSIAASHRTDLSNVVSGGTSLFTKLSQGTESATEVSQEIDHTLYNKVSEGTTLSGAQSQGTDSSTEVSQEVDHGIYKEVCERTNLSNILSQGTDEVSHGANLFYSLSQGNDEVKQGADLSSEVSHGDAIINRISQNEELANPKSDGKFSYLPNVAITDPQSLNKKEGNTHLQKDFCHTHKDTPQSEIQKDAELIDVTSIVELSEDDSKNKDKNREEEATEATKSQDSEGTIAKEKTLIQCLLTKTFMLYLFWAVAVQIILSMALGTFNPWLEYVTKKDKAKVSEFTDVLFYSMLGSPVLALCFGLAIDAMKRVKPGDNKTANVRTLETATVSLGLTSILGVVVCGFFMTCNNDVIVPTSILLVLFRTGLYSCGTAFLRIMYPTNYFGILCGIMSVISGTLSFLQYPLFLWIQNRDQAWMEVFGFLGIVGIVSLVHPAYLYWKSRLFRGDSNPAKQNSYTRLTVESPGIQDIE